MVGLTWLPATNKIPKTKTNVAINFMVVCCEWGSSSGSKGLCRNTQVIYIILWCARLTHIGGVRLKLLNWRYTCGCFCISVYLAIWIRATSMHCYSISTDLIQPQQTNKTVYRVNNLLGIFHRGIDQIKIFLLWNVAVKQCPVKVKDFYIQSIFSLLLFFLLAQGISCQEQRNYIVYISVIKKGNPKSDYYYGT